MNASDVIQTLLKSGVALKDIYVKGRSRDAGLTWEKLLSSDEMSNMASSAIHAISSLSSNDLDAALEEVRAKEQAILRGRDISDLSAEEARHFATLVDVEDILVRREIAAIGTGWKNVEAFVDNVLPVLVKAAPMVLPLLL